MTPLARLARSMFAAAVAAVAPDALVRRILFTAGGIEFDGSALHPPGKLHLVALGKAGPGLAAEFLHRSRRAPDSVFVLAPDGAPTPASVAGVTRFAAHPVPDGRGAAATAELLTLLAATAPDDAVVLLVSGGASALLAAPLPGVELDEAAALTAALLAAGVPTPQLNAVRKHLFAAAGGRLAAATPAALLALVLSDVPGDDLAAVASGPTTGDPSTFADALAALARSGVATAFPHAVGVLAEGARGGRPESPKPGDPRLARAAARLLGSSADALAAAAATAQAAGLQRLGADTHAARRGAQRRHRARGAGGQPRVRRGDGAAARRRDDRPGDAAAAAAAATSSSRSRPRAALRTSRSAACSPAAATAWTAARRRPARSWTAPRSDAPRRAGATPPRRLRTTTPGVSSTGCRRQS